MNPVVDSASNAASALIDTLIESNRGDRQAFVYNAKRYSFQDVAALMNRAGSMLKGLSLTPGARVLLLLPPSPAFVAGLLGAMKAGAVGVVGAPRDAAELERCVAAAGASAAIVHETLLAGAERALAALPRERIVVVGSDTRGYRSFVDDMRAQPSWLAAEQTAGAAPALGVWTGSAIYEMSHAALTAFVRGGALPGEPPGAAAVLALLRAFSQGEEATLA